jgi:hypothetical protein
MDGIVDLSPDDPRAKEALIGLIGSTFAQLKEIDSNVVGGSNNIKALKTDVKGMIESLVHRPQQQAATPAVQLTPMYVAPTHTAVAAGINVPAQLTPPAPQEDPNQLVFDFNMKITPDTINDKLDRVISKLDRVIELFKN